MGEKLSADWYFDVISPFAYLQFQEMARFEAHLDITLKPVLFAGLLKHWGQLGPAEIEAKRIQTYRQTTFLGQQRGTPLRYPDTHPFNPLGALRLCLRKGSGPDTCGRVMAAVFADGLDLSDGDELARLEAEIDQPDVMDAEAAKAALRLNTEEACGRGVFGVPTFVVRDEIFWGLDSGDLLIHWLEHPDYLASPEIARLTHLGAAHRQKD